MVRSRDPFATALNFVRTQLRDGDIPPGTPLSTADMAGELKMSITPVREALCRLVGEGLVEDRRGVGYYARKVGQREVEELYRLHWTFQRLALRVRRAFTLEAPFEVDAIIQSPSAYRAAAEAVFDQVVRDSQLGTLSALQPHLADRLSLVRLVEMAIFADAGEELATLVEEASRGRSATLVKSMRHYHSRRIGHARALADQVGRQFRARL